MMHERIKTITWWLVLLSTCVVFSGCIGKQSPEVTYYSLLSMEQMAAIGVVEPHATELRIGIGPITIPDALKRTQIVTRDAQNVYRFDEYHRWAGILEKDMAVVLGDNLEDLLGAEKVAFFPWMQHFKPSHRIIVDVIRFDGALNGEATLSARWAITDAEGKINLAGGKSVYHLPVKEGGYAGLLRAESLLLAELSKEIAKGIKSLPGRK